MYDVAIVGGGPGGAAAAVALGQRGVKNVVLIDRDPFPRDKTCGSGLSPNALTLIKELGIDAEVRERAYPIMSVKIVTPGGREMVLASNAAALVLLRRHFDNLLIEKAKSFGVEVRAPWRADGLITEDDRVIGVRGFDGSEIRAKYVLCADGANSIFSHDPRPKRSIATLMGWWDDFTFAPGQLEMIFDKDLAPLYGWLFPESNTRVNIGICVDGQGEDGQKTSRNLRETFDRFLQKHYGEQLKTARQAGKLKGHPIVYTTWVGHVHSPGALFLGEAARITHNATGEGISQAMQSGVYAAEALSRVLGRASASRRRGPGTSLSTARSSPRALSPVTCCAASSTRRSWTTSPPCTTTRWCERPWSSCSARRWRAARYMTQWARCGLR